MQDSDQATPGGAAGGEEAGRALDDAEAQQVIEALEGSDQYAPPITPEDALAQLEDEGRALPEAPENPQVNLNVPYIHQMWDTANEFDGRWACGPTSTAMVLAYYGFLDPKEIAIAKPKPHTNPYGWYISNAFTHGGRTYDTTATTKNGRTAHGLYGAIVHQGLAHADTVVGGTHKGILVVLREFFKGTGNTVEFISEPTRKDVEASLDEGHPVIISGNVFGWPHIVVIRGYHYDPATNVYHWLMNDPHGYKNAGTYDGESVAYRWNEIYAPNGTPTKYMYRIRGPFKPA